MASPNPSSQTLRKHLLELLGPGGAHVDFEKAIANVPDRLRGTAPPNVPHTPWRLLEHLRIAQHDIVEFTLDARHGSPKWPDGYWPDGDAPPSAKAWDDAIREYKKDRRRMLDLVGDENTDLLTPVPHGDGQTIAREAMLLADHSAYHLGQLIVVRRALGDWE